ncbi:MAG: Rho-binding antiterminator [Gammaproteobacteria bacterium]|nr:Rho-binding antiterminator [Gammaproteobacteria bacterium]MBU1556734.1 Rho-binding antiterminator [Gammaproteobacteria bacterium]MBU2070039.1 Rho-binding antiterminator [Gammaproteobacteria bacterium]MBU2183665.1 Rho-binding antiterminator [Gammaproteobacteria bacterium]MBU2205573.1 Rho-binding antiterminator [Gammaproteobacteria bacterium]
MLKCDLHDYIEIVCLYHYPLKLTLSSGAVLSGTALTTRYNDQRQECLLIAQNDTEQQIVLDDIALLEVMVTNPHLQQVRFK